MAQTNFVESFSRDLADRLRELKAAAVRELITPNPPFHVRASEEDQLRTYVKLREPGPDGTTGLWKLRKANGGPRPDEDVDRYARHMEYRLAKAHPDLILKDMVTAGLIEPLDLEASESPYTPGPSWFEATEAELE